MDMITTNEDVKKKNQIRIIVRQSVFLLAYVLFLSFYFSSSCNHSTLL